MPDGSRVDKTAADLDEEHASAQPAVEEHVRPQLIRASAAVTPLRRKGAAGLLRGGGATQERDFLRGARGDEGDGAAQIGAR